MIPRKSWTSDVLLVLALLASCCFVALGFQVVSLKQQQQQQVIPHHIGRPAAPAASVAAGAQEQHNAASQLHQSNALQETQASPKANHRLVSKLKDARHRRRNRHHRHHRHYQKAMQQQQVAGGAQDRSPAKLKEAGGSAAFAALTAMAGGEPTMQAASSTALTALESIVEEVARVGAQQLASAVVQPAPQAGASAASQAAQQQQQQQAPGAQVAGAAATQNSSPSISGHELLLNGSASPVSVSLQPALPPPPPPAATSVALAAHSSAQAAPTAGAAVVPSGGITRGPLHSTRSFLLTSTLSKIYNLLNVTEFALEMRDGISSRASCVACNAVVGLFLSPLYSKEVFSAAIRTVCVSFRIQSARVCAGLVESFQDDFEYIRKNTKLTRDEICGVVFGVDCARRQTHNLFWTIHIPDANTQLLRPGPGTKQGELSSSSSSAGGEVSSTPAPQQQQQPPSTGIEHGMSGMGDAPDLFEYRRSNIFVVAASEPAASHANSSVPPLVLTPMVASDKKEAHEQAAASGKQLGAKAEQQSSEQQGGQQAAVVAPAATMSATEQAKSSQKNSRLSNNNNHRPMYMFDEADFRPADGGHQTRAKSQLSTFVHLTDIHIDPYYEPGSLNDCNEPLCCRATSGPMPPASDKRRQAGRWGDYGNCDVPVRTLRNALQRISETHPEAEYWIWTGDISPHDIWNISKSEAAQHVRLVTKMVRDYSNGLRVFPVIGNHEAHPVNSFSPPEIKGKFSMSWLYDLLANEWSHWLPEDAMRTLRIGGYYKLKAREGLRILALNTNYCARLNPWSFFDPVDPAGQLRWLVDELMEAESKQDKVHIIGHVPPDNRECTQSWLFNFINIVDRFRDTIQAQFYGHTHRDEWRVVYSLARADEPIGIQYIGPSITPFTENNPAYRIYYQDNRGFIEDSETYYFNLTEANETPNSEPKWRFSYSHRRHLNMTQGLNAQSFHQYLAKLSEDDDAFDMFYKNFYRFSDVKMNGSICKNKCKQQILSDLRLSHPYKTRPKPFLANRKTSNHHHHHHHHHHRRLKHQERSNNLNS